MTLQVTLTSSHNIVGLSFTLRQKVYICIYTHFDISKIYKNKKAVQLLPWVWINKTNGVNEWWDKESYLYWIFSFGPDYFFTKYIDIDGLAMLVI